MEFDPRRFDEYREGNHLEVKAANGGLPGSLWDTYSSFANSYGGCIICGVVERKDGSWKTTGLRDLTRLKKDFWDTIHNKSKVSHCLMENMPGQVFLTSLKHGMMPDWRPPLLRNCLEEELRIERYLRFRLEAPSSLTTSLVTRLVTKLRKK